MTDTINRDSEPLLMSERDKLLIKLARRIAKNFQHAGDDIADDSYWQYAHQEVAFIRRLLDHEDAMYEAMEHLLNGGSDSESFEDDRDDA